MISCQTIPEFFTGDTKTSQNSQSFWKWYLSYKMMPDLQFWIVTLISTDFRIFPVIAMSQIVVFGIPFYSMAGLISGERFSGKKWLNWTSLSTDSFILDVIVDGSWGLGSVVTFLQISMSRNVHFLSIFCRLGVVLCWVDIS